MVHNPLLSEHEGAAVQYRAIEMVHNPLLSEHEGAAVQYRAIDTAPFRYPP